MDDAERRHIAAIECARAQVDLFFIDKGYGSMHDADHLAAKIARALRDEGRLS